MNCIDCRYNLLKDGHYNCTYEGGECIKINVLEKENAELKAQIEKMKCCENCRWEEPSSFCDGCKRLKGQIFSDIITSDNWELRRY